MVSTEGGAYNNMILSHDMTNGWVVIIIAGVLN